MKQLREKPQQQGLLFLLLLSQYDDFDQPMSNHVAANLAKWWKTKFLNGYKQFTVVPTDSSDGRPSDTEELLSRHHREYSTGNEKDVSEDKSPSPPPPPPPAAERRQLNFEQFECDVSVEGGVDTKGQERQEFSFTLYDFDGHGKITKDDIAGLVTTIYDTLGSTIKVPHYGSKTIKVKLTVSPDQRKKEAEEASANADRRNNNPVKSDEPAQRVKFKRDLNVTIRESRPPRRPHRRKPRPPKPEDSSSDNNEECAADVSDDDDEDDPLAERMFASPRTRQYRHRPSDNHVFQQRDKKRSSSLQREELLQIIQANMEKNNLSFQTSRKHCPDRTGLVDHHHSHHRHRHKAAADCYLDLAGLKSVYEEDCHYDKLLGAVVCASAKHAATGYHQPCCSRGHHRSRSHDLSDPIRYHLLDAVGSRHSYADPSSYLYSRSKSHEDRKVPHFVLGHTSSPHHLKHRNREEDQARAMAQVVSWLEQEFSSSLDTSELLNSKSTESPTKEPTTPKKEEPPNSPTASSIERHEHHHVHEHVHHHYHHYQDMPVLV